MGNMKEKLNKEKNLSEIQKLKKNSQIKRTVDNLINRMDQWISEFENKVEELK